MEPGIPQGIQQTDARGNGHTPKHGKSHLNIKNNFFFFYDEDGQAQQQVAQRACGVSILGDIQNLTGRGHEQGHMTFWHTKLHIFLAGLSSVFFPLKTPC